MFLLCFCKNKKKPLQTVDNQLVEGISLYPDPGSNRDGSESTGVWDQRVYRFRHLGIYETKICFSIAGAKVRLFF